MWSFMWLFFIVMFVVCDFHEKGKQKQREWQKMNYVKITGEMSWKIHKPGILKFCPLVIMGGGTGADIGVFFPNDWYLGFWPRFSS